MSQDKNILLVIGAFSSLASVHAQGCYLPLPWSLLLWDLQKEAHRTAMAMEQG
jgi:hypothetical protein